ncbi:hypothetical protein Q3G72_006629 [Acer saccharum]|nr:hypothetical protein Q3G72_006629 [Acer saccharum]
MVVNKLVTINDEDGPITGVSWALDGRHIVVGLNNSNVQVWDSTSIQKLRTLICGHRSRIDSLAWNENILTIGGMDGKSSITISMASSNTATQWLHRLENHTATVKALAWCPFQGNLLASSGDRGGKCIKLWNTHTRACLNSVDTGSPSPDGYTIANAARDETMWFWNVFRTLEVAKKPISKTKFETFAYLSRIR